MAPPAGNLAAFANSPNDMQIKDIPVPEPKDDEVLLRMGRVGICGSDVKLLVKGRIGAFVAHKPIVLGHESSGTVVKCGSKVKHLNVGDRVAIEPGIPCRLCDDCRSGRYNLCRDVFFCACPPHNGNLCQYYTHAADFCYKLPDHVSLEEGALMEPLGVALHACRRANVTVGASVLVCGAGPIGLMVMLTARAMGAANIAITDISEGRLKFAESLGANHTFLITPDSSEADLAKLVKEKMGNMPELSMECSGTQGGTKLAILATRDGGSVMIVGNGPPEVTIPLVDASCREVNILSTLRSANCYPTVLSMIATGQVNVKPLVTHHFKLQESKQAFETSRTGAGGAIKVIINCEE